jgi:RimJ/RimL family protein N-acetyltransferase
VPPGITAEIPAWRLRAATIDDTEALLALASCPPVFRYLFDGAAPDRQTIAGVLTQSIATASDTGLGMWLLECAAAPPCGCVQLRPDLAARSAELIYLLHPRCWGQGLATRMAWTAITQAFLVSGIDLVVAGTDLPNIASLAVLRRLGMRFRRNVRYPLGVGVEYALHRDDPAPRPCPGSIAFVG